MNSIAVSDAELLINSLPGRGTLAAVPLAAGNLSRAAKRLAAPSAKPAFVTGFFLPNASPPASETDGPIGTAILAKILELGGTNCPVITDCWSANVVRASLASIGHESGCLVVKDIAEVMALRSYLMSSGVTDVIFVERPGSAIDGKRYSMKGIDISAFNLPFEVFADGVPWTTIAIGDGGNEIGMGAFPRDVFEETVPHASLILATQSSDLSIVANVSNWACYAIAAALGAQSEKFVEHVKCVLSIDAERQVLDAALAAGAVDGVKLIPSRSVDGFAVDFSGKIMQQLLELAAP